MFSDDFSEQPTTLIPVETMREVVDRTHEDEELYDTVDDLDVVLTDLPDGQNFSDEWDDVPTVREVG